MKRLLLATLLCGCKDEDLDTLGGHELGIPISFIWGQSESGKAMVIASNFSGLCLAVDYAAPPGNERWWVVSLWTVEPWNQKHRFLLLAMPAISATTRLKNTMLLMPS